MRISDWSSDVCSSDLVERLLLPLLARLGTPPVLAGYCLGGTMALAAACAMPVAGLAMIAAPWRFAGFSDRARGDIASLWQSAEPACAALGLVPMEVLQTEIGRASWGERVCQYVEVAVVAGSFKKK